MTAVIAVLLLAASDPVDAGAARTPIVTADFVSYLEWILSIRLGAQQREEADAVATAAQGSSNPDDRRLVARAIELETERKNYSATELTNLRSSVEDEYLKTLRNRHKSSQVAQWILRIKADATRPIANGKPPLTRHVADCLAELSAFVVAQVDETSASADRPMRDAFARLLVSSYSHLSAEEKAALAAVPAEWARVRALWANATDEKRRELRETWRAELTTATPRDAKALVAMAPALAMKAAGWR